MCQPYLKPPMLMDAVYIILISKLRFMLDVTFARFEKEF